MQLSPDWSPRAAWFQGGVFTRAQALADGATPDQVKHRVRRHLWVPVLGDGLRLAAAPATPQMLACSVRLTWPDAVVCRDLAGHLHGFPVPVPGIVDVWAPRERRHRAQVRTHRFALGPHEVVTMLGATLTSPARTLLDLLAHLPPDLARSLLAWAVTRRRLSVATIEKHLRTHPGRWGAQQLRSLVLLSSDGALSEAERRFLALLRAAGITGWQANTTVHDRAGIIGTVDVLFPDARLVVEIDGRSAHGPEQFQHDRTRQNRLVAAGYRILRFTWDDITRNSRATVAQLRALLGT